MNDYLLNPFCDVPPMYILNIYTWSTNSAYVIKYRPDIYAEIVNAFLYWLPYLLMVIDGND